MARYTGPVCRLCRREGQKLFLKGERCLSPKCALEKRPYPPGMHGKGDQFQHKASDYALQLREKQKAKRIYGVLERQFRRYFQEALRSKGLTGATLLIMLERRLDNVVYRLGLADSRAQARQLVRHGHFTVNGKKTDIPSFLVKVGDVISVRERSRKTTYFKEILERLGERMVPEWLSFDRETLTARVVALPTRDQIDVALNEQLIVEYYSR
ncbi:MAG: 30S ribosomal protein S4 [Anaerolineae bacterium]|nr:30S ribosomal protein S4 [Anaerolineae bacterium]MDW8100090.1 30S ribosomal protein S4 [Anaerolineae bacterium]